MSDPTIKYSLAKYLDKGEDAWTQQPAAKLALSDSHDTIQAAFFGVFDGHGGKAAATFASRGLLTRLQSALKSSPLEPTGLLAASKSTSSSPHEGFHDAASHASGSSAGSESQGHRNRPAGPPALHKQSASKAAAEAAEVAILKAQASEAGVHADAVKFHDATDDVIAALPAALVTAFENTQTAFFRHTQTSGSTATVVVVSGWEVIVASVGDSLAYVDTGSEVVQVSGNHRLDDSQTEQDRILAAGAEVAQSEVDGHGVGPLRVWPGGLAMGRTLGDASGGDAVLCVPEIRQLTLPQSGGRVIVASDGLWDLLAPKTAAHHVRGLPASKAASELVALAARNKKPRDDITVIVVDVLPPGCKAARYPPLLGRSKSHHMSNGATAQPVDLFWPLDGEGASQWRRAAWARRVAVAVEAQQHAMHSGATAAAAKAKTAAADAANARSAAEKAAASVTSVASIPSRSHSGTSDGSEGEVQYASELHRQMAMLQLDPSEYEFDNQPCKPESCSGEDSKEVAGKEEEWETVGSKPSQRDDRSGPPAQAISVDGKPGQLHRDHQPKQQGRGRGRSPEGGRFADKNRGRGRGSAAAGRSRDPPKTFHQQQHQPQRQQQHYDEAPNDNDSELIGAHGQHDHNSDSNIQLDDITEQPKTQPTDAPPPQANGSYGNGRGGRGRGHDGRMAGRGQQNRYDRSLHEGGRGSGVASRPQRRQQAPRGPPTHLHQRQQQPQDDSVRAPQGTEQGQQERPMREGRGRNGNRERVGGNRQRCDAALQHNTSVAHQQQQQRQSLQADGHTDSATVQSQLQQQVLQFRQLPFRVPESPGSSQLNSQQSSQRQHPAIEKAQQQAHVYDGDMDAVRRHSSEHSTANAFGAAHRPADFSTAGVHLPQHQQQQHQEQQTKSLPLQLGTFDSTSQSATAIRPRTPLRFGSFGDDMLSSTAPHAIQHPPLGTVQSSGFPSGPAAANAAAAASAKWAMARSTSREPTPATGSADGDAINGQIQQPTTEMDRARKREYGGRGYRGGRGRGRVSKQQQQQRSAAPSGDAPLRSTTDQHPRHSDNA